LVLEPNLGVAKPLPGVRLDFGWFGHPRITQISQKKKRLGWIDDL